MTRDQTVHKAAQVNFEILAHGVHPRVGFEWRDAFIHDPFTDPQYGAFKVDPVERCGDAYLGSVFATDPAKPLEMARRLNPDLSSGPAYGLYYAALAYLAAHPEISQLCTNDMALPFGGKFDLNQDWQQPHSQHDRGTAADVAAIGSLQCANAGVNVSEFIAYCVANGAPAALTHSQSRPPHADCGWEAPTWPHWPQRQHDE